MTRPVEVAKSHYGTEGLTARIQAALVAVAPETQQLSVADLAAMDHFHTRGIAATRDLAALTPISSRTRVLDLGCGIGGPARFLAATFGCTVIGVDLSASFIDAARYLTRRCGLEDRVSFDIGNALDLPFDAASFHLVFLQHVVMNVEDRAALYTEINRVLVDGGRLATHDVVRKEGEVRYPVPWARDASASFLLTARDTIAALDSAGFDIDTWRDDSELATRWFATLAEGKPPAGPTLAVVIGPEFATRTTQLARNLAEGRIGILSAVAHSRRPGERR